MIDVGASMWTLRKIGLLVGAAVAPFACGGTGGLGDAATDAANSDAGEASDAMPGDCTIIYVSTTGDVRNSGCSPSDPLPSIVSALSAARARSLPTKEVHVCKGTYSEKALVLDQPISLFGGYDCTTWTRDPTYAYPTLKTAYETRIVYDVSVQPTQDAVLDVVGPAVGKSTTIDGFTIAASDPTTGCSASYCIGVALRLEKKATPAIANNVILGGGSLDTPGFVSIGLAVSDDPMAPPAIAGAEITHNYIHGGSGKGEFHPGSTGVSIQLGGMGPHLVENVIDGGSGSGDYVMAGQVHGSVGIDAADGRMTVADGNPIERNTIHAGTGKALWCGGGQGCFGNGDSVGSIGVVAWSEVDLTANTIDGGAGSSTLMASSTAVEIVPAGRVRVLGNTLFGGTGNGVAAPATILVLGRPVDAVEIDNNFIVGPTGQSAGRALWLASGFYPFNQGVVVARNNTIVAPRVLTPSASQFTPWGAVDILVDPDNAGAIIQNNIFIGRDQAIERGLMSVGCAPKLGAFDSNVFVSQPTLSSSTDPDAGCVTTTLPSFEAMLDASASNNARLAPTCSGEDGGCWTCATAKACGALLFDTYTDGVTEVADGGLKLNGTGSAPCAVTQGARDFTTDGGSILVDGGAVILSPVAVDFYGTKRTPGVSRGAHEAPDNQPCK
jgi:hypothetical protein